MSDYFSQVGGSLLVRSFTERTPGSQGPFDALLRRLSVVKDDQVSRTNLGRLMQRRNINQHLTYVPTAAFDACIEPTGRRYQDGFKIVINRSSPASRARFSLAHEICHTFFYEIVPEIKYSPHSADAGEEHLCNFGAAEILMPTELISADVTKAKPSLSLLETLARKYEVTSETMLLRLRSLRLWNCSLLFWRQMVNGTFALAKVYGERKVNWEWEDSSLLQGVWTASPEQTFSGKMPVTFERADGMSGAQIIHYQMTRRRDLLVCLWSRGVLESPRLPLFAAPPSPHETRRIRSEHARSASTDSKTRTAL